MNNVSPDLIVYSKEPAGHLCGLFSGIQIIIPTTKLFGSKPGFNANIAFTVVLYLLAIVNSVSPDLIVYSKEPAGHLVGGGGVTEPGIQIIWPI